MTSKQDNNIHSDWYEVVRDYTVRLAKIRSVSPGEGENRVAHEVLNLLCEGGLDAMYTAYGLDSLAGDLYERHNVYAFLRGHSPATVILLGHIDTVDTKDYGSLEPLALDPEQLTAQQHLLWRERTEPDTVDDWLFGRGVADMKSGVAINIALLRRLAQRAQVEQLPLSILLLATPDEENESAGVLQAVDFLQRLQAQYQLSYLGVINTDYSSELYPGDPHHYVYTGTVGKLLPGFLCIGCESHVGAPFNGIDANLLAAELIRDLSMNDELCDRVRGQITAPPVTLHAADLKAHYDVQVPFAAHFYLNVLTFNTDPRQLLTRLHGRAEQVLKRLLATIDETEHRWRLASQGSEQEHIQSRTGVVLTYAELYQSAVQHLSYAQVETELNAEWERWPAELDKRERSLYLVQKLWTMSGRQGPAVILYYAPPYYPHVAATSCILQDAITAVVQAHPEARLVQQEYFPYLSDLSYLRLDGGMDLAALKANMPVWQDSMPGMPVRPGSYYLPLEAIRRLNIPVANFGVHGRGAHQSSECVATFYSFGMLPQLLYETIEDLGKSSGSSSNG